MTIYGFLLYFQEMPNNGVSRTNWYLPYIEMKDTWSNNLDDNYFFQCTKTQFHKMFILFHCIATISIVIWSSTYFHRAFADPNIQHVILKVSLYQGILKVMQSFCSVYSYDRLYLYWSYHAPLFCCYDNNNNADSRNSTLNVLFVKKDRLFSK